MGKKNKIDDIFNSFLIKKNTEGSDSDDPASGKVVLHFLPISRRVLKEKTIDRETERLESNNRLDETSTFRF